MTSPDDRDPRPGGQQAEDSGGEPRRAAAGGRGVRWDRARKTLAAAGGTWRVPLLLVIDSGMTRPRDILAAVNALPGDILAAVNARCGGPLSHKMLHDTLNGAVRDGLVDRRTIRARPPETHYFLTHEGDAVLEEVAKLGAEGGWHLMVPSDEDQPPPGVRTDVPSVARIYDYFLDGKDNFALDRQAAEEVSRIMPLARETAQVSRAFLRHTVANLSALGVRQFLDIGSGLPTVRNVHEVAQALDPSARVVYADNDPMVLAHARALLASSPEGRTDYIHADLRDPGKILARAAATLDFTEPVAVMLVMVLHFVSDEEDPWGIVSRLMSGISGTGYVAIAHVPSDIYPPRTTQAAAAKYNEGVGPSSARIHPRSRDQVERFFSEAGAEILRFDESGAAVPGNVLTLSEWAQQARYPGASDLLVGYVGIGRRPAPGP
jgi:DNA-binding HxlR family transcriptional regulator